MVKLVRLQHLGVESSVGRSLSRSAVRWEFVRIGDEGGGPPGHQMDRIHSGNISPARQFMRLRSGSVGSDTVRLGLPKKGTPADYLNGICGILCDTGFIRGVLGRAYGSKTRAQIHAQIHINSAQIHV